MTRLIVFTLLLLHIYGAVSDCPSYEAIYPCRCVPISATQQQIECTGEHIDDVLFYTLAGKINSPTGKFQELNIHHTMLTTISTNVFANVTFSIITIENNEELIFIDPYSFKKGTTTKLIVRNNPSLGDTRLFDFARHINPSDTIQFDGNGLMNVPPSAFAGSNPAANKVKRILLNHNAIASVHSNAFYGLPMLQMVSLDFNEIELLSPHALSFSPSATPRTITVYMNTNKLTEISIQKDAIAVPENVSLEVHMEYNEFQYLPEFEFKFVETPGNKLYIAYNQEMRCDCNLVWLYAEPQFSNVNGIQCYNFRPATDFKRLNVTQVCRQAVVNTTVV